MIQANTLRFLRALSKHNDRSWFDAHRDAYGQAKSDVEGFLALLIPGMAALDPALEGLTPKQCLFRINRDTRFSKDKHPYKTNFGAHMAKGGRKSPLAGYYLHIEAGASMLGGGLWMPMPPQLGKVRQEIDYCLGEFESLLRTPAFRKAFGGLQTGEGMSLRRVPKGYEADNPAAEHLKLKSFVAMRRFSDEEVLSKDFLKQALSSFRALKPLIDFLNRAVED